MGKGAGCVPSKKRQPPATTVAAALSSSSAAAVPRDAPEEALDSAAGESARTLRLYIVFYSMYGHVEALARHAAAGASTVEGVEVVLRRVPETLSPEVLEKMQAPAKDPAVPVVLAPLNLTFKEINSSHASNGFVLGVKECSTT
uniref:Uncharacterized protein n=2 Tax=Avena sativa TaxID=4498 RepID=A0ACD5TJH4_AVESA